MADWAGLHQDLLASLAKQLGLLEDFISFARVCKSWRSAAVKHNFNPSSQQSPWLMLANPEEEEGGGENSTGDYRRFVCITKGGLICNVKLPEARKKQCLESLGWLVTISETGDMNLLNPISGVQIGLPHITTLQYYILPTPIYSHFGIVRKAVLSSVPSPLSNDYALMIIYDGHGNLGFWRPGDETWTTVQTVVVSPFTDIIFYKGQFYGVGDMGIIVSCDIWGPNPTAANIVGGIRHGHVGYGRPYIVESQGKLLIVVRDGCSISSVDVYDDFVIVEEGRDVRWSDESIMYYGTQEFRVFLVDLESDTGRWGVGEITTLMDNALFLGDNASISLDPTKFPGIRPNCIYYTDDCSDAYIHFTEGGGKDMGIYNLEDRSRTSFYKGESCSLICPPLWIFPSFLDC